ncbi:tyrosinase cofactor [Streptomyces violarus]|uniref:tyrosinase cofactor n=1 Tax=Streptomyces violarus TaxID=67380 RepID=UPI0021C1F2A5|nr:tyrosinase cofactor [Streptomyces violarus]MCT9139136.1 tyrosinase cofactor [Streptomyces violarus]
MAVSIGGGPARDGAPAPAGPLPAGSTRQEVTRREVTRGLRVCAFAAALTAPVGAALWPQRLGPEGVRKDTAFAETYRGRRIGVAWTPPNGPAGQGRWHVTVDGPNGPAGQGRWHVTVDGRPLHLMRRADGIWLSMVDHYCSYRTPLEAARAAVDALGPGQRLREPAPGPEGAGHVHTEDRRGVRT